MGNRIRDCWSRLAGLCSGSIGHNGVVRDDHNEEASGDDNGQADHYDGGAYHDFRQAKHHNVFDYSDAALHDIIDSHAEYDYDYDYDYDYLHPGDYDYHRTTFRRLHTAEFHNLHKPRPDARYDNDSGDW